jgi:HK97 family phage portal protein
VGFFDRFRNKSIATVQLVTESGNGYYEWDGNVYQSDIVRACLRPKVKAIGKLVGKHIRETISSNGQKNIKVNPEPYIRFLLEEPNPLMTGQMLQEKLAVQLCLNNNAFALIIRDGAGYPESIWPISASTAEAIYTPSGTLFLKFLFKNGKTFTFPYSDIIHLRSDFKDNDLFGEPLAQTLAPLMTIVTTTDQGIVKAIKNSSIIRWLLKFTNSMRPEDIEEQTKKFAAQFLDVSNGTGVAGVDAKADATQISPNDYVPNALQMDRTTQRIYALFNTNEKIVTSIRTEEEWNSYFDAEVEPVLLQLQGEYTRKLFSRKERGFGNYIAFEASSWDSASITTKLNLMQMVDRGALTPNEWRATFNLAPVEGGDKPIRRLDTGLAVEGGEDE